MKQWVWKGRVLHVRGVDRPHHDAEQGLKCSLAYWYQESEETLVVNKHWNTILKKKKREKTKILQIHYAVLFK